MRSRTFVLTAMLLALVVAGVLSSAASSHPDGLEHVAGEHGFLGSARDSPTAGWPLADYAVAGVDEVRLSGGLAGVIGCVLTFAAVTVTSRLRHRNTPAEG